MIDRLLMKLRRRDDVSAAEEAVLRRIAGAPQRVERRRTVIREGDLLDRSMLLLDGLACRYKDLRNGQRQISELHVGGDFVDLHGFGLKKLDHSILTLSECTVSFVPHGELETITRDHPHLTRLLWLMTSLDAAIHRAWVLSLGRRTALSRLAHLFCELRLRFEVIGVGDAEGYPLELTQADLAECLGLSLVHVNRTLRELRGTGFADFRNGRVSIADPAGLARLAEFDRDYLVLEKLPR
jgi:CRP-like cAMP-binding protein